MEKFKVQCSNWDVSFEIHQNKIGIRIFRAGPLRPALNKRGLSCLWKKIPVCGKKFLSVEKNVKNSSLVTNRAREV